MLCLDALIDELAPLSAAAQLAQRSSLPRRLLRASRAANPRLRPLARRLDALQARLDPATIAPVDWTSPEVHAPLVSLGDRCPTVDAATRLLDRLDVLTGRAAVDGPGVEDGVHRLEHLGRGVVRRDGDRAVPIAARARAIDHPLVYLPVPGLFADLPFPSVYDHVERPGDFGLALARYLRARELLACGGGPAVCADLDRIVGVVALLPPPPSPGDGPLPSQACWSFNLRLRLPGAVFVNPFTVEAPGVAEGLLHEYLHQRMWLWWELCPPSGLPDRSQWMRSPVSGQPRPAITMVQAAVIFHEVEALHRALLSAADLRPDEREFCQRRVRLLATTRPELGRRLAAIVPEASGAWALVKRACGRPHPAASATQGQGHAPGGPTAAIVGSSRDAVS